MGKLLLESGMADVSAWSVVPMPPLRIGVDGVNKD